MRILLLGRGRMGTLIERLAPDYGCEIVGVVTAADAAARIAQAPPADVAIDFTIAEAVAENLPRLAARGTSVVIGTTGWSAHEEALRAVADEAGIGVLAAANFSLGLNIFQLIVEEASRRFAAHAEYGAFLHERHHAAKKDAPSGTALQLQRAMTGAGYPRAIDVSSVRAGAIPGTHEVGFDGPSDSILLSHTVRDRAVFARGALEAARWLSGRHGWFTMRDMLSGERV